MIEEKKEKYVFVIHLKEPEGQVLLIPASKNLTFEMLVKKINQNPAAMTLKGKDGLNVIITRPAETIGFVVEDKAEIVQENIKKMAEAQRREVGQIVTPKLQFPGRRGH